MDFRDRFSEMKELQAVLNSNRFEFVVIFGRRRIGKTELVLQATKNKKRIYYLAVQEKNLERFSRVCSEFDVRAADLRPDFEILLDFFKDKAGVVVIDEFQNLISENKAFVSNFQSVVDSKLKDSKLKLVILGSSVSIMKSRVLSYQSPLYGRRTATFKLKAVSFFDLKEFFPPAKIEELLDIYGFADGIPYYLVRVELPFWKWLETEIKSEKSFLRDEVDFLLRYEFDNPRTYKGILEAIANGKTKLNEIKQFVKAERTDLSPYLRNLLEIELIRREMPVTESENSRNGRYYLNDNFLKFWFRFIYPNASGIESGIFDVKTVQAQYSEYLGRIFEQVCKEFLIKKSGLKFTKIGKWWDKQNEIDWIAFNEPDSHAFFVECKFSFHVNALEIANQLKQKTGLVDWKNKKRVESYVIIAKSFAKKLTAFEGKKVYCYDLTDF